MSIRIQNDGIAGAGASQIAQTSAPTPHGPASTGTNKNASGADRVDLSSLSGTVATQLSALASQQANRVSQLASLYAKGQYQVNPGHISRALISKAISTGAVESEN
jgi:anti-sigma28 factor (negative regulator of flagellin synthesis)